MKVKKVMSEADVVVADGEFNDIMNQKIKHPNRFITIDDDADNEQKETPGKDASK